VAVKPKTKTKPKSAQGTKSAGATKDVWLRDRTDKRTERRFAPKSNTSAALSWILIGLGAAAIGAGFFGQFLRGAGPHPYSVYLLIGGAIGFAVGMVVSNRIVPTLRIGDAGLAVERGDQVTERLGWHEIDAVRHASGVLVFSGAGKVVSITIAEHPNAAAIAVQEGRARIPGKMPSDSHPDGRELTDAPENLAGPSPEASEVRVLEPPQLAGLRCAASNRLISFEADARICGRCGQAYHREEVPKRCVTCDARLG
jgi:hypothetical protein